MPGHAEGLVQLVDEVTDEGLFCTAVQLSVRGPTYSASIARGDLAVGVPVSQRSLFSVHCGSRPLLAMTATGLLEEADLNVKTRVSDLVAQSSPFANCDFRFCDVLTHSAPLAAPRLIEVNLTPVTQHTELLKTGLAQQEYGYSDYSAQMLFAAVIEHLSGVGAREHLERAVLKPMGLLDEIKLGFTEEELERDATRIGFYTQGLPTTSRPMLCDRSPHLACLDRVALGAYASADGLASFYQGIGMVLNGGSIPGLPSCASLRTLLAESGPVVWHEDLRREGSFAAGFMVNLASHGFGSALGDQSFGHAGFMGTSYGFHDPTSGVSGGVVTNGLHSSPTDLDYLRSRLVSAMIRVAGGGRE